MYNITLKSRTCIRAKSLDSLIKDISTKVGYVNVDNIKILGKSVVKETIRRPYNSKTNTERYIEPVFEWPDNSEIIIGVSILTKEDKERTVVQDIINRINAGLIRFGNDLTLGCGEVVIDKIFDEEDNDVTMYFKMIPLYPQLCINFSLVGEFKEGYRCNFQKSENSNIIIPASSVKGILRRRFKEIIEIYFPTSNENYKDYKQELIKRCFGSQDDGISGFLIFRDSVLQNVQQNIEKSIHIDKFSRDIVYNSGRVNYSYSGTTNIQIKLLKDLYDKEDDLICYLILLVLRDISNQRLNIGGGFAQGKGFFYPKELKINRLNDDTSCLIDFTNERISNEEFLQSIIERGLNVINDLNSLLG